MEQEYYAILKRAEQGMMVIPVVVRVTHDWKEDEIGQFTPAFEGNPIGSQENIDAAWGQVMAWIKEALAEFREQTHGSTPPAGQTLKALMLEISTRLARMEDKLGGIEELQELSLAEHGKTQSLIQASTDSLINKISGVKEFQGTVFEYLRAMEERLQRGADLNHKELQILLSCIEDGLTLVMEEMDESQKEQLKALSPKSSGGGLLDILKLKVALIPMALALLSGEYEKAAELLTEALILDTTLTNGKKMLVEAWTKAQHLLIK
ncbi:MAG: hypothetical protein U0176_00015 [Bacteroidia bacterium]